MSDKPRPEDYPDQINAYTRAMRRWQAMQPPRPLEPIPEDLEGLFTPESLARAKAELKQLPPIEKEVNREP